MFVCFTAVGIRRLDTEANDGQVRHGPSSSHIHAHQDISSSVLVISSSVLVLLCWFIQEDYQFATAVPGKEFGWSTTQW
jgi:hypothetical protein